MAFGYGVAGTGNENLAFAGVALVLALLYFVMTIMNLFGEKLGSPGRKFIFEMDKVMGGLLGIPHYSKFEGILLLFAFIGLILPWTYGAISLDLGIYRMRITANNISLVSVLGIMTGAVYLLICIF